MTTLNKEDVKEALREIMYEDKAFFRQILLDLLSEDLPSETQPATEPSRAEKVDAIIRRDFERYHNVFKALA